MRRREANRVFMLGMKNFRRYKGEDEDTENDWGR